MIDAHAIPGTGWPEADATGWSEEGLASVRRELDAGHGSTALMIVEHGNSVFTWGDVARKSSVASVRKSLINILYGIQVEHGLIRLSDTLERLGIDDVDRLSNEERQATVADLLMARSGVYHPAVYDTPHGRPTRGTHVPGEYWFYNNWDFNVLGTILRQSTGQSVGEAFSAHLACPLHMQDFAPGDAYEQHGPESLHPVYKFRLSARDLARIGLLYLRGGSWSSRRIVSNDWVHASTSAQSDLGGGRGYGLLWWTAQANAEGDALATSQSLYYGSGLGGQYVIVIPKFDLVVVHRAAKVDRGIHHGQMGHILRLVLAARPPLKPQPSSPAAPVASSPPPTLTGAFPGSASRG